MTGARSTKTNEMPIKSAKYVNTYYGEKPYPIFLKLCIIFALIAVVALIIALAGSSDNKSSGSNNSGYGSSYGSYYGSSGSYYGSSNNSAQTDSKDGTNTAAIVLGIVFLAASVGAFLLYKFKRDYVLACSFGTDANISTALSLSSQSGSTSNAKRRGLFALFRRSEGVGFSTRIRVNVKPDVAQKMANELGSVIACASIGDFDSIAD